MYKIIENKNKFAEITILVLILIIAIILQYKYVLSGLPMHHNIDEEIVVSKAYRMFISNDYTLNYFKYPVFNFYFCKYILKLSSLFNDSIKIVDAYSILRIIIFILRNISGIFLYYGLKKLTKKRNIALYTFCIYLFSLYNINLLFYVGPDNLMVIFINILVYFSISLILEKKEKKRILYYAIVYVIIGILASIKYNGLIYIIIPIGVLIYDLIDRKYDYKYIYLYIFSSCTAAVVFAILNVQALIDSKEFINQYLWNVEHYKNGHMGLESSNNFIFYIKSLILEPYGFLGGILALIGSIWIAQNYKRIFILFTSVIVVYLTVMCNYKIVLERNIALLIPLVYIAITFGIIQLAKIGKRYKIEYIVIILILGINILPQLISYNEDARVVSQNWIIENIEPGSNIFIEGTPLYLPHIDNKRYNVIKERNNTKTDFNKKEYFVASSYTFGRYFQLKEDLFNGNKTYFYPDQEKYFKEYFSKMKVVKTFRNMDTAYSVYKMNNLSLRRYRKKDKNIYLGPEIIIYEIISDNSDEEN